MEKQLTTITKTPTKPDKKNPIGLLIISSVAAGYIGGWASTRALSADSIKNSTSSARQIVSSEAEVISQVAKDVGESVVSIDVTSTSSVQDFFGNSRQVDNAAAGTGVIVSDKGIIITNKHVVPAGTSTVKITLFDGTVLDAEVLARDTRNDIAFVKVGELKGKTLKAAKLGDSTKLIVGQKVIAIGNALGEFQNTVTSGIVSGYGRNITAGAQGSS